jgi:hypothetical protein
MQARGSDRRASRRWRCCRSSCSWAPCSGRSWWPGRRCGCRARPPAAARAAAVGADPEAAARATLPPRLESGLHVREERGEVGVAVRVPSVLSGGAIATVRSRAAFRGNSGEQRSYCPARGRVRAGAERPDRRRIRPRPEWFAAGAPRGGRARRGRAGGIARAVGVRGELQSAADLVRAGRRPRDARRLPARLRAAGPRRRRQPAPPRARASTSRSASARAGRPPRATARATSASPSRAAASRPIRVRVTVRDAIAVGAEPRSQRGHRRGRARAAGHGPRHGPLNAGEYRGPFAYRQGKPMRPDVALAFDRMAARAAPTASRCSSRRLPQRRRAGAAVRRAHPTRSGSRRPEGRCTASAPSSTSARRRVRLAGRQRRALPLPAALRVGAWHFGYALNAGSSSLGYRQRRRRRVVGDAAGLRARPLRAGDRACGAALERVGGAAGRAALRGVALQPVRAVGGRGARHRAVHARHGGGLRTRRSLRRRPRDRRPGPPDARPAARVRAVPLALAAYNAGPTGSGRAAACPPIPETQSYVADILGLLHGAGDPSGDRVGGLEVRLVR